MTTGPQDLLDSASREELSAVIQLLARSVAQHRQKQGFVRLELSAESFGIESEPTGETGVFIEGGEVLEEALELVRAQELAIPATAAEFEEDSQQENRTQFRLNISTPIKVLWPGESKPADVQLMNISWGGVAFHSQQCPAEPGQLMRLMLPRQQGGAIAVEVKVLRVHPADSGAYVSVRFASLSTRDEEKLMAILEHLAGDTDAGQRNFARLTQRLELQFDAVQELESTLHDISAGGLGITVPDPLKVGQSLQTVISTMDERCSLKLRARVVRQEPLKMPNSIIYRVGLKFEHPTAELERRTAELIGQLASFKQE
ncbi:MAG: PilZ domain-containing protein [Halioglobus sp.]|nr:PilZ domain-containing protein [Halioglobus sp.]